MYSLFLVVMFFFSLSKMIVLILKVQYAHFTKCLYDRVWEGGQKLFDELYYHWAAEQTLPPLWLSVHLIINLFCTYLLDAFSRDMSWWLSRFDAKTFSEHYQIEKFKPHLFIVLQKGPADRIHEVMNQSLVLSVFWKENELQRLIGTSCQWLVLLNVVLIRASNKAVHQLTTNSNISFSLHFQSFNVYGSNFFLSKPIIMPLLWCLCLNCTELRTFPCLLRKG